MESGLECNQCNKKCKTKDGLARHMKAKHEDATADPSTSLNGQARINLSLEEYCIIVNEAALSLTMDRCFPTEVQDAFKLFSFETPEDSDLDQLKGYQIISKLWKSLMQGSDAEKFYAKYFSQIALQAEVYFAGLNSQHAVLLSTKIADKILARKNMPTNMKETTIKAIGENEKYAMQYLGGYVIFNLNKKFQKPKSMLKRESQQCIMILQASKADDSEASHELVDCLNRGKLWKINSNTQEIFLAVELEFKKHEHMIMKKKTIDIEIIVSALMTNMTIIALYQNWIKTVEAEIDESIAFDLLEKLIRLYIRVRSFSATKDIVNKYRKKHAKTKALRTELKKSHSDEK